jgi:poly(3-hydroxyalkanoate) synthetase
VAQGITVFLVSWRNPQAELGHLGWDDYLELGALKALDVAREVSGADQLNALGFCVGGTILSAALSVAKARGEEPAASLTLLTTLLDFSDGGEVTHYVDLPPLPRARRPSAAAACYAAPSWRRPSPACAPTTSSGSTSSATT